MIVTLVRSTLDPAVPGCDVWQGELLVPARALRLICYPAVHCIQAGPFPLMLGSAVGICIPTAGVSLRGRFGAGMLFRIDVSPAAAGVSHPPPFLVIDPIPDLAPWRERKPLRRRRSRVVVIR